MVPPPRHAPRLRKDASGTIFGRYNVLMGSADKPSRDVALITGPTEDNKGARVVRIKQDEVSMGELRTLEEGKPIVGEVVKLTPREGQPNVCDVDVVMDAPKPTSKGPAKVATDSYRANWDRVFGAN